MACARTHHHLVNETWRFGQVMTPIEITWNPNPVEGLVLDVGCGSNQISPYFISTRYTHVVKMLHIDNDPSVIEYYSKLKNPKYEFYQADISNWNTVKWLKGTISKIVSLRCLNEVKCQNSAFENIFKLLKRGGDVILLVIINSQLYDIIQPAIEQERWKRYFENNCVVPESHRKGFSADHYSQLMYNIGFVNVTLTNSHEKLFYQSAEDFKADLIHSSLCNSVPAECRRDFVEDVCFSSEHSVVTPNGTLSISYNALWIHAGKPHHAVM